MSEITEKSKKWYCLRVVSGKERKIREYIELEVKRNAWDTIITQIIVPTEKVYKIRNGKKVVQEKNFFPGYILVEMEEGKFTGEMISTINNTTNVIHFLGKDNPIPMREVEVNRILGKVDEVLEGGSVSVEPFIVNETVKIIDGPFNEFEGVIEEIYDEKKRLKVIVKVFGRRTPVELNFTQVEKI
jgi:transcriptional antiterminator NusG